MTARGARGSQFGLSDPLTSRHGDRSLARDVTDNDDPRGMHRACLAACPHTLSQRGHESVAELCFGESDKGADHRRGDPAIGEEIAGRDTIRTFRSGMDAQGVLSRPGRGGAVSIDCSELSPGDQRLRLDDSAIASDAAPPFAMESSSTVPSRGSVIFWVQAAPTPARAHAQRAATAGDDDEMATPNCPLRATAPRDGKRHESSFAERSGGITAVASISTTHSGRARAVTTIPVETGKTPFSQRPIT